MFITVHFKQDRKSTGDEAWAARRVQVDAISDFYGEKSAVLCFNEGTLAVRETPAEIMALVKAAQRERDRMTIAARLMAAAIGGEYYNSDAGFSLARDLGKDAVNAADALLAALDARGGAE